MSNSYEKSFPLNAKDYEIYEEVGEGVSATVYRALCIPLNVAVAVKVLDLERCNNDSVLVVILLQELGLPQMFLDLVVGWLSPSFESGGEAMPFTYHIVKAISEARDFSVKNGCTVHWHDVTLEDFTQELVQMRRERDFALYEVERMRMERDVAFCEVERLRFSLPATERKVDILAKENKKVRMDAYRGAILNNPSLMKCASVMDVGCGTGILRYWKLYSRKSFGGILSCCPPSLRRNLLQEAHGPMFRWTSPDRSFFARAWTAFSSSLSGK